MRKSFLLISFILAALFSCSSDDDGNIPIDPTNLSGTHWIKTTDNTRHFTFTSSTEYVYSENGSEYQGTYTFDGANGVFDEGSSTEIQFKVNGNILSANQNFSNLDFEALYEKQ